MMERRKLAFMGLLTAAALALSFLERSFPPLTMLPGTKLGLANIVTVLALYILPTARDAFQVVLVRVLLGGFFAGAGALLYSFTGAMISFFAMAALKGTGRFSVTVVSMVGGVMHNVSQLVLAALVLESASLVVWVPLYGAVGLLAGFAVGTAAALALKPLRQALRQNFF